MDTTPRPLGTGSILSPKDYRDGIGSAVFLAAAAGITLPGTFHTNLDSVLMQSQEPACVSNSIAKLIGLYWFQKTGVWHEFSPRFLDTLVKRYDGVDRATGGTYPRMVMKLAAQFGCATTATVPNDTSLPVLQYRDDKILTAAAFAEAATFKIPGYVQVPLDFTNTRNAIFLYGAISALFAVGNELYTAPDGTVTWQDSLIDPLRTPKKIESGHQMTPNGWTSATLNNERNSWSAAWANNGEIQYDPHAWAPYTYEQWAVAEIPANVSDFLKNLPSPANFHFTWNTDLHQGDNNDDVKFAQIALMILGFLAPVDPSELGIYGPKTAAAVFAYQHSKGITPPAAASIGPRTRSALNKQFAI